MCGQAPSPEPLALWQLPPAQATLWMCGRRSTRRMGTRRRCMLPVSGTRLPCFVERASCSACLWKLINLPALRLPNCCACSQTPYQRTPRRQRSGLLLPPVRLAAAVLQRRRRLSLRASPRCAPRASSACSLASRPAAARQRCGAGGGIACQGAPCRVTHRPTLPASSGQHVSGRALPRPAGPGQARRHPAHVGAAGQGPLPRHPSPLHPGAGGWGWPAGRWA